MGYFLQYKDAFVSQNERVKREQEFFKNIFIGNELCLIDKKYDKKRLIFLNSNNFFIIFLDKNIDIIIWINFIIIDTM